MATLMSGNVRMAVRNLQRNKMRSLLTMLGVIIGVMSVVLTIGIGEGIKHQVSAQTEHLGKDLITIRPGQLLTQKTAGSLTASTNLANLALQTGGSLSAKDVDVVRSTPQVANAAPLSIVSSPVTSNERSGTYNLLVIGTTGSLPSMLRQGFSYGGFFGDDATSADKVVIGAAVAKALFDERVPLGQTLTVLGHQFIVTGIFDEFQSTPFSTDADFNDAVFIPYNAALSITNSSSPLYEILARPTQSQQTDNVVHSLESRISAAHGGSDDFTILKQTQTLAATNQILHLVTLLIGGVAAIALLVGGIGIMNIMLVSITERMHEIGIRKALGATTRQIALQFITEAAVLSTVGGAIGVIVSFAIELLLWLLTPLTPDITWQVALAACVVSIAIGIIFGSAPALKAAHKEPIAALRSQ